MTNKKCSCCKRNIPEENLICCDIEALNNKGKDVYICSFCKEKDILSFSKEIDDDNFGFWLRGQTFGHCISCGYSFDTWNWIKNNMTVEFECDNCGETWTKYLGFGNNK